MSLDRPFLSLGASPRHGIQALVLCLATAVSWGSDWYVATTGSDTNAGTSVDAPLRTLQEAGRRWDPGDTAQIRAGVYRDYVHLARGGTRDAPVTVMAHSNETVVFKGSDVVTNWTPYSNSIWVARDWPIRSQQVFESDTPLRQVGWPNEWVQTDPARYATNGLGITDMTNGTFFYDTSNRSLYVWCTQGQSPTGECLEVSIRPQLLNAAGTTRWVRVNGLGFAHSAAYAYSPGGWPAVHIGTDSSIISSRIERCDSLGLHLGDNAQARYCRLAEHGRLGASFLTNGLLFHCSIVSNNTRGFSESYDAGGIKVYASLGGPRGGMGGGTIQGCEVAWNSGHGIWFDQCRADIPRIIRDCYVHDNAVTPGHGGWVAGIMMEISQGADIYNNLVVNNGGEGLYVSGSDRVRAFHNTFASNRVWAAVYIESQPRRLWFNATNYVWASLTSNLFLNNIVADNAGVFDLNMQEDNAAPTNVVLGNYSDYNLFFRSTGAYRFASTTVGSWTNLADFTANTGWDSNSMMANPGFLVNDPAWALSSNSPAIDAGSLLLTPSHDRLGTGRPLDGNTDGVSRADMGAMEYVHPAADSDADGIPDTNEVFVGTNPASADSDGDTFPDGGELIAGTDPLDSRSLFSLSPSEQVSSGFILRWLSASNRTYGILRSTNLAVSFDELTRSLSATPPLNVYTDTPTPPLSGFYQLFVVP